MRVILPKQASRFYLGSLNPLSVIKYADEYYVVVAGKSICGEITCLNMQTGALHQFDQRILVEQVKATLTIRGVMQYPERKEVLLTDEETGLIRAGRRISAIKSIRERTWCSLNEAKRAVEAKYIELGV